VSLLSQVVATVSIFRLCLGFVPVARCVPGARIPDRGAGRSSCEPKRRSRSSRAGIFLLTLDFPAAVCFPAPLCSVVFLLPPGIFTSDFVSPPDLCPRAKFFSLDYFVCAPVFSSDSQLAAPWNLLSCGKVCDFQGAGADPIFVSYFACAARVFGFRWAY
jgi:hypothetical protein